MLDTCKLMLFVGPFLLRIAFSEMPLRHGPANSSYPGLENTTVLQQNSPSLLKGRGCSSSARTTLCSTTFQSKAQDSGLRAEPKGESHLNTNLSTCPPFTLGKATTRKTEPEAIHFSLERNSCFNQCLRLACLLPCSPSKDLELAISP